LDEQLRRAAQASADAKAHADAEGERASHAERRADAAEARALDATTGKGGSSSAPDKGDRLGAFFICAAATFAFL
jgi:hypothetical protein